MTNEIIFSELIRRCRDLDPIMAHRLACVWSGLMDRIIKRMLDICDKEIGPSLHIDQKAEVVLELAKLSASLCQNIVNEKAKRKALDTYSPDDEAMLFETHTEQVKIDNTARNLADRIWKPLVARWRVRRPLIETTNNPRATHKIQKPIKHNFRKHMHYVPQSTTRQWTSKESGKFNVYSIGLDGEVRAKERTAKQWGTAPFLYTQKPEHLLGLIEGDAKVPYQKLLEVEPFNEMDTRRWIAFLISQLIRTPRFMRTMFQQQIAWIERSGHNYPVTPAHLGRVFETLFQNNDLYAAWYPMIAGRAWSIARAADGLTFLKGDIEEAVIRLENSVRAANPEIVAMFVKPQTAKTFQDQRDRALSGPD